MFHFQNAQQLQLKKKEEVNQYQILLTEIEIWLQTTRKTIESFVLPNKESQIEHSISDAEQLSRDLQQKEVQLAELTKVCEELKKSPEVRDLVESLLQQLKTLIVIFAEQKTIIRTRIETLRVHLIELQEKANRTPDLSLENTLDSSSMPVEEIPIHTDTKKVSEEFITTERVAQPTAHIETQTGRSLSSPVVQEAPTKDFSVTYNVPVDAQIQAELSKSLEEPLPQQKETIVISKTVSGGLETIQIATAPMASEPQPIVEEPDDDLTVEANYRKRPESETKTTDLTIVNANPNQPFETVFVEPDETTTEVIVDADGTKRIIVKKLHRTVVRHQESLQQQQQFTTFTTVKEGEVPVTQSFSQVTLKGQQSSTTVASGDGKKATLTSQQYGGKVISGAPGGEINVQEFQSEPETHYTYVGDAIKPDEVEVEGIKLHEGDITLVDSEHNKLLPVEGGQITLEGNEIHTSSSSVRAVVQQVTRRIIRKTRRIIRKTVIIDGKEHVTEEVIEEPEEVEVTEEGIPRVSINVTRTEDGKIVEDKQFGEPSVSKTTVVETAPETTTIISQPEERYVVETHTAPAELAQPSTEEIATSNIVSSFLDNERLAVSSVESSVEKAPSTSATPSKQDKKKKKGKKTPEDELKVSTESDKTVSVAAVDTTAHPIEDALTTTVIHKVSEELISPPEQSTTKQIVTETVTTTETKQPEEGFEIIEIPSDAKVTKTTEIVETKQPKETIETVIPRESAVLERGKTPVIDTSEILKSPQELTTVTTTIISTSEPIIKSTSPQITEIVDSPSATNIVETTVIKSPEILETSIEPTVVKTTVIQSPQKVEETIVSPREKTITETITKTTSPVQEEILTSPVIDELVSKSPKVTPELPTTSSQASESLSVKDSPKPSSVVISAELPQTTVSQETINLIEAEKVPEKLELPTISKAYSEEEKPLETSEVVSVQPGPIQEIVSKTVTKSATDFTPSAPPYEPDIQPNLSMTTQNFILSEQLHEPTIPSSKSPEESSESPKGKKKRKFSSSKTKKLSPGTPRTQSPIETEEVSEPAAQEITSVQEIPVESVVLEETKIISSKTIDPVQGVQIDLSLEETQKLKDVDVKPIKTEKPKEPSQAVEIELSLQEKQIDRDIKTPKVEVTMKIEEDKDKNVPAEVLQKDIHVVLPSTQEKIETVVTPIISKLEAEYEEPSTPSDLDHGGRKSKKKKKHKPSSSTPSEKEETEEKSIASSLVESMEINIPEDSQVSEDTPKPTHEDFQPVSESDDDSGKGKDTGYEADKTTVDESLADDDDQEKKKRRKKKKKQKIKIKDSEESQVPKTPTDSSPIGESVAFTDDEPSAPEIPMEEPKKSKKRKTKGKRKQSESEPDIESSTIVEAQDEEIQSPNESYHTISTQSEPGTVKVIQESIPSRPESESPKDIASTIVTVVPVLEGIITQEGVMQTSPVDLTASFIEQERVSIEKPEERQTSAQTSPEAPKDTSETSIQTTEEFKPDVEKPETTESTTQFEIMTTEIVTQTSPEPSEPIVVSTVETATSPIKTEVTEISAQTVTPERVDSPKVETTIVKTSEEVVPKTETSMQTTEVITEEVSSQTKSPVTVETTEISVQSQPEVTDQQTSPDPSAPPMEVDRPKSAEKEIIISQRELSESVTQTSPVPVQESKDETPTSSEYEVVVKTTVIYPSDTSTSSITPTPSDQLESKNDHSPSTETLSEGSEYSNDEYSINVEVDGKPIDKNSVTTFIETEKDGDDSHKSKRKRHRKRKKHPDDAKPDIEKDLFSQFKKAESDHLDPKDLYSEVAKKGSRNTSPIRPEDTEVFTKVYTTIGEDNIKKPEEALVNVSVSLPQKPEITPEDIEIITKDVFTTKPSSFQVDSMLTEAEVTGKDDLPVDVTSVELSIHTTPSTEGRDKTKDIPKEQTISQFKEPDSTTTEDVILVQSVQLKPVKPTQKPSKKDATGTFLSQERQGEPTQESKVTEPTQDSKVTSTLVTEDNTVKNEPEIHYTVTEPKPKQAIKPKGKNKHVSSVTIEEVQSPQIVTDTPLTPASDAPLSPPNYPTVTWKPPKRDESTLIIESEKQLPIVLQDVDIRWNQAQALERFKNLQNAKKTTHLSDVLYLATLNQVVTDESVEQRDNNVKQNLEVLQQAVEKRDVVVIQQTIITTVETITTWLETIEYRIYVNRQQTADGPSKERVQEFNNLKEEIANIDAKVDQLQKVMQSADNIYNEEDRERMRSYIESLQQQVKVIEEVTEENEQLAAGDLQRWEDFVNGVDTVSHDIRKLQRQLSDLKESDASPQTKLSELDKLENNNRSDMLKAVHLKATAKSLLRDFPTREIPKEVYVVHEMTKQLEQQIITERVKALQLLSLADEYEQTLKEFKQIIVIAEALVESSISVKNLEHLEDEMQNHRKFFVNLSHCRAILESLEENLDSETRAHHSELHNNLYDRAKNILDKSSGRFQQMSLAASRWTVLEQGTREEMKWLQVAQQRVPELNNVTSSDYDRYIDLYQSLADDIAHHHNKLIHLNSVAQKLQELVYCSGLEEAFSESLDIIVRLQEDVDNKLERLSAFREAWSIYDILSDKVEYWIRDAEAQLKKIDVHSGQRGHMRQFWVSLWCRM